jgi:hypothetical protein
MLDSSFVTIVCVDLDLGKSKETASSPASSIHLPTDPSGLAKWASHCPLQCGAYTIHSQTQSQSLSLQVFWKSFLSSPNSSL